MQLRNWQSIALAVMFFLGTLSLVTPLPAQDRSATPVPNTVWVGADGKFEAEPDTVLVQFNISAQEDKLQDANQKASRAADQVRQLLRSNGLDPKDAQVGRFSVQPVYDYKNPKRKLVGYRVETNISIKLKDFSKVGPITEGLADMADVTGDQSLSYLLDDMDAAKDQSCGRCVATCPCHGQCGRALQRSHPRRTFLCVGGRLRAHSNPPDGVRQTGECGDDGRSCPSHG